MSLVKGKPPVPGSSTTGESSGVSGGVTNAAPPSGGNSTTTANGGASRKKSILKKSEISIKGPKTTTGSSSTADPELENLLVSDQETSANSTPAISRKKPNNSSQLPVSNPIVELPPTANNEQLKSLTGPKLRKAGSPMPPGVGNRNQQNQKK